MEDLTIEELRQLALFYRQRYIELDFINVQLQLKINRFVSDAISSNKAEDNNKIDSE